VFRFFPPGVMGAHPLAVYMAFLAAVFVKLRPYMLPGARVLGVQFFRGDLRRELFAYIPFYRGKLVYVLLAD